MLCQVSYYIILFVLISGSFLLLLKALIKTTSAGQYNRRGISKNFIKSRYGNLDDLNILSDTGLNFSLSFYKVLRYVIFGIFLILIIILKLSVNLASYNIHLFLSIFLFLITTPRESYGRFKLPFFYFLNFMQLKNRREYNNEIYRTISHMINLFNMKGDTILGSNYIFDQIIRFTDKTKPIYLRMLSFWNMNRQEEAVEYFAKAIGTTDAKNLTTVFLKLDHLKTRELIDQLIHYRNNMRMEKVYLRERINERNGNIMYGFTILSAVIVLINFLVIVLVVEFLQTFSSIGY